MSDHADAGAGGVSPETMVDVHFRAPEHWRELLAETARLMHLSAADLLRMMLRAFLRERFNSERVDRDG